MVAEVLSIVAPILQTGAVGAMLIMTWRLMVRKDKKIYEMFDGMEELIREVTSALVYKNVTDDKMSEAIKKLTEQLREVRELLKEKKRP